MEVIESWDEVVLVNFSLLYFVSQFQRDTFYQAKKYVAIGMEQDQEADWSYYIHTQEAEIKQEVLGLPAVIHFHQQILTS